MTRGVAAVKAVPDYRMCQSCLTLQPSVYLVSIDLGRYGFPEAALACASPVVCRQRAQLRGVWGVYR